jgi:hypothetical protein
MKADRSMNADRSRKADVGGAAATPTSRSVLIERGAVTERIITRQLGPGDHLVLGPQAVLTPLAHDQARARGITIERRKRC